MGKLSEESRVLTLVFTDLAGSTALKQMHGDATGRERIGRHRSVVRELAETSRGRIVDWAGDGCFLTFETASSGVVFALNLQRAHQEDASLPPVRVGIHIGEVSETPITGSDFEEPAATVRIEGLAVDITARICNLAQPGQILMSAAVRHAAQPRIGTALLGYTIAWHDYGAYRLKGFDNPLELSGAGFEGIGATKPPPASDKAHPIRRHSTSLLIFSIAGIVAVGTALTIFPLTRRLDAPIMDSKSSVIERIVVLPFENRTGDDANDFLAVGLGEELSSELGKIGSLVILAHSAARSALKQAESPMDAARQLDVDGVVEGSVWREGENMRVRVTLIRTGSAEHLWSAQYDLEGGDGLQLQSRWALDVANAVNANVRPEERRRLQRIRPTNAEAEEAYMNGLRYWSLRTPQGFIQALNEYQRATQLDPTYADAYGALATAWAMMADYVIQEPVMACTRAREYATLALDLDETVIDGHMANGFCTFLIDLDYPKALEIFEEIKRIEPSNALAVYWHSNLLFRLGLFDDALDVNFDALFLDPTEAMYIGARAAMLLGAHRDIEAMEFGAKMSKIYPQDNTVLGMYAAALIRNGRLEEAREILDRRKDNLPRFAYWLMRYGAYRAMAGQPEIAREVLDTLRAPAEFKDLAAQAAIHASLGEIDTAFELMEQAFDNKNALLTSIVWDPAWDNLRTDPRYLDLLMRYGLPEFAESERLRLASMRTGAPN